MAASCWNLECAFLGGRRWESESEADTDKKIVPRLRYAVTYFLQKESEFEFEIVEEVVQWSCHVSGAEIRQTMRHSMTAFI